MTIKVYLHAITCDGLTSVYVSLSEEARERKVAAYCRFGWRSAFPNTGPPPYDTHKMIKRYFGRIPERETLHYDTDWLRPEDFAACPNATVIDDSVLLTPTPI